MICKRCADAADRGAARAFHCDDDKCPCQHRPISRPARRPKNRSVTVLEIPAGPYVRTPGGLKIGGAL